jgi:putative endonuclease
MAAYVYIMASKPRGTLYVGVTSDLVRRVHEHKIDGAECFTKRYGVHTLVHFEIFETIEPAIIREKQIKKWNRAWKVELIETKNLYWEDLYGMICT